MAKKIKFALELANGVKVRSIDELRENYDIKKVKEYYLDGRLSTWLQDRFYDEEVKQVNSLNKEDSLLSQKLCEIFEVVYDDINPDERESDGDVLTLQRNSEKRKLIEQITADKGIIESAEKVALEDSDIEKILSDGINEVLLYGEYFSIDTSYENVKYIGVGEKTPTVDLDNWDYNALSKNNINFENVNFSRHFSIGPFENPHVGDIVQFGVLYCDGEAIPAEWKIIDLNDGKNMLLICKEAFGLGENFVFGEGENVTWASSRIRAWLNDTFLQNHFTQEERELIMKVEVEAHSHPYYGASYPGDDTQDYVFLLSFTEARRYFPSNKERRCTWWNSEGSGCYWWLRTPANNQFRCSTMACVDEYGYRVYEDVNLRNIAYRPALWITNRAIK